MEEKIKVKKEGITLVSLVITIIVLLILAGITINLIIGEDGIIRRAQEAGKNYMEAAEYEKLQLGKFNNEMDNIINGSTNNERNAYDSEFRKKVVESINNEGVETLESDKDEVIISNIGKIFEAKTKDATALSQDIIKNKTAYVNGEFVTGTMENRGMLNWNPTGSTSKTIEPGYYSGGTISTVNAYTSGVNSVKNTISVSQYTYDTTITLSNFRDAIIICTYVTNASDANTYVNCSVGTNVAYQWLLAQQNVASAIESIYKITPTNYTDTVSISCSAGGSLGTGSKCFTVITIK